MKRAMAVVRSFAAVPSVHEIGKIEAEIAAIGDTRLRCEVDTDFDVLILDLHLAGEAGKGTHRPSKSRAERLATAELQQRGPQGRDENRRQRAFLGSFDRGAGEPASFGIEADAVQKHRLPYAPQSVKNEAPGGTSRADAVESDGSALDDLVAPRQFGRRITGTGCVGVRARVQAIKIFSILSAKDKIG